MTKWPERAAPTPYRQKLLEALSQAAPLACARATHRGGPNHEHRHPMPSRPERAPRRRAGRGPPCRRADSSRGCPGGGIRSSDQLACSASPSGDDYGRQSNARIASALTSRVTTARFGTSFTGAVSTPERPVVWCKNGTPATCRPRPPSWSRRRTPCASSAPRTGSRRPSSAARQADQVILVGSGDPSFSSAQLAALAQTTAATMKAAGQLRVRLYADDSPFRRADLGDRVAFDATSRPTPPGCGPLSSTAATVATPRSTRRSCSRPSSRPTASP